MQAKIKELQVKVDEYETLKAEGVDAITIEDLAEMFLLPIKYRIAAHMTQEAFAKMVDVQLRTLARYEAEEYQQISAKNLTSILHKIPLIMEGFKVSTRK